MKRKATKRILSTALAAMLALGMVVTTPPGTLSVHASDTEMSADTHEFPELSDYPELRRSVTIVEADGEPLVLPPSGLPNPGDTGGFTGDASDRADSDARASFVLVTDPTPGSTKGRFYDAVNQTFFNATAQASGTYCNVYVADDARQSSYFTAQARNIADTFDTELYRLVTDIAGEPKLGKTRYGDTIDLTGQKINIVLVDLNKQDGLTTGGYFRSYDMTTEATSGQGAILTIDSSEHLGYPNHQADHGVAFYGVIAHEFQHLIAATYGLAYDSEFGLNSSHTTWLNESLSGLVDAEYAKSKGRKMNDSHLEGLLSSELFYRSGYVPTDPQWAAADDASDDSQPYIISHYGSASMLGQEFHAMGGDTQNVVSTPVKTPNPDRNNRTTYNYAEDLAAVGSNSGKGGFDAFFTQAALATAVSSPTGDWRSAIGQNLWQARKDLGGADTGFASVTKLAASNTANSGGRNYFSQIYISDPIGETNDYAKITLPADPKAEYYAIVLSDPMKVARTDDQWIAADKRPILIESGKYFPVGSNNRFAVVAINYGDAVSESFQYAAVSSGGGNVTFSNPTTAPDPLVSGTGGEAKFTLTGAQMIPENTELTLMVVSTEDENTEVSGFTLPATVKLTGADRKANLTVEVKPEVPAGAYKIVATAKIGAIDVRGISPAINVTVKAELKNPAADGTIKTDDVMKATALEIQFDGEVRVTDTNSGVISIGHSGKTYTAAASKSESGSRTISVPYGDFKSGGEPLALTYNGEYTVKIGANTVSDLYGAANAEQDLGKFYTDKEPPYPTVTPAELTIKAGETSAFRVFFGSGGNYKDPVIYSEDEDIATVDVGTVETTGAAVKVSAHDKGETRIMIQYGLSSTQSYEETPVKVIVTKEDGGLPSDHSPIDPPAGPISPYNDAVFTFAGVYSDLGDIRLNGNLLTQTDQGGYKDLSGYPGYSPVLGKAEPGSVKVTLYKEFLQTLPNGTYTLTVAFLDGGEGELDFEIERPSTPGYISPGGGSSGGSSKADTSTPTVIQPRPVTLAEVMAAYRAALPKAQNGVVTAKLSGWFSEIDLSIQQALAKQAAVDGVSVKLQISQRQNFATVARLTLNPAKATVKVALMSSCTSVDAVNRAGFFRKWYSNKLFVVSTGQTGSFGQPMELVVKPDLTGFDTTNLVFYSYDKASNTYKRIEQPDYWIDMNGYLHFTTEQAGDIVVSEGALEKR